MKPKSKDNGWVRVRYRSRYIYGWADESSVRDVHGIVQRPQPIRREIWVNWDNTYPSGYINVREILRER